MDFKTKLKILIQSSRAFNFMHKNSIAHRDIKTHNVLITENLDVKICDFGLAQNFKELNKGHGQFSGTPSYMAPEMFNKKPYSEKVDIFAFGTIIWEIFSRKTPFFNMEVQEIKSFVCEGNDLPTPKELFEPEISSLVASCRNIDPSKRPDFESICNSLSKLLNLNIK